MHCKVEEECFNQMKKVKRKPSYHDLFKNENLNIMNTENTKAQMRKGILEFCILSLINAREMYVSDLIDELKKGKLDVVEGTLYPLLTRLKNGEFLSYRWEESTGGPPRKYYQMTEKGKLFLAELLNTWNDLTDSVNFITKKTNPTNDTDNSFENKI